jgi:predicted metal-dependent HD superfamily phosphohydrolase
MIHRQPIQIAWDEWLSARGVSISATSPLWQRYLEPHRAYHRDAHILAMLQALALCNLSTSDEQLVRAAIFYHDAIYHPHSKENEERSAQLAEAQLPQILFAQLDCARVARWIRATAAHTHDPNDALQSYFLDLDLGILGAPTRRYIEYSREIRREYAFVPRWIYRKKRRGILQQFLKRPALFVTPIWHARLEAKARANLRAEINYLGTWRSWWWVCR